MNRLLRLRVPRHCSQLMVAHREKPRLPRAIGNLFQPLEPGADVVLVLAGEISLDELPVEVHRTFPADVCRLGAGKAFARVGGDQTLAQVEKQLIAAHLRRQQVSQAPVENRLGIHQVTEGSQSFEWRLARQHLDQDITQTCQVRARGILAALEHLRRCVGRGPHTPGRGAAQVDRRTDVDHFGIAGACDLQEHGYIRYDHLPLATADRRQVDVEFVSNLYQSDHEPVIQCNVRDITARRQLEWARAQAQASADLHRRKDEFLAMLSHELRNPLAPILNAVELLRHQGEGGNPLQAKARAIIERQVGQLKALVDEMLEVSRITTGRIRLHYEYVDMRTIVDRAVESARPLIDQRHHQITVSLSPEPIWLHADSTRLEQVVVNLLTNAAKYTDEGGRISLTLEREGDEAVLRVRDTGVGIAPELLPRIFELFTQAERSLDRSQGGLGVGLTIVQKLVEMHRGRVQVYSALGHGSEFVVRLPVDELPEPQPQAVPIETAQRPAHSLRVLVVDDNVDQAESAALLLRVAGHEVWVANSGPAALDAAIQYRPDLVLMDIGLPGMDGYEIARRLRQQPGLQDTMLVAVTGYGQESDRQRSHEAGFDHHLVKPVTKQVLQAILATPTKKP